MVTDLLQRIRAAVKQRGVTAAGLAYRADLHRNTLIGIHSEGWNPTAETLRKLEPLVGEIEAGGWVEPDPAEREPARAA